MYKVMWLLQRKEGITPEQFRDHYENSHARLAQKYFGDLMVSYKRNYKTGTWGGGVPTEQGGSFGPSDWQYDCIAEWGMPDEAAFNEIIRLLAETEIGKIFHDDEEHFLHRDSVMMFKCETCDSGTGDGAGRAAALAAGS